MEFGLIGPKVGRIELVFRGQQPLTSADTDRIRRKLEVVSGRLESLLLARLAQELHDEPLAIWVDLWFDR
jgi:hypothetical protein